MYEALYLHVPFCKNICDYCALYSVVEKDGGVRRAYLDKMDDQLQSHSLDLQKVKAVFVGGGTPTQLTESELAFFLNSIATAVDVNALEEWTFEGNPSSCTKEKLQIMFDAGVNRLSFGAQSTSRETKKQLGRRSSLSELEKVLSMAREVGFANINLDMIYGIPGQNLEDWRSDLERVFSYSPEHFSAYSLILEDGTPLSRRIDRVDDALAVDMYDMTGDMAMASGFERYEVSNYAKQGKYCRHNYNIWLGAPYLGIGPAAASYDGRRRWTQVRDLKAWIDGAPEQFDEVSDRVHVAEAVGFGLRTNKGWPREVLRGRFEKVFLDELEDKFSALSAMGWLEVSDQFVAPTEEGMLFADSILEYLLP